VEYGDESFFVIDDHGHDTGDLSGDSGIGGGIGGGYDDDHAPPDEPDPPHQGGDTGHPNGGDTHTGDTHTGGGHADDRGHGPSGPAGQSPHVPAGHLYVDYEGHHYDAGTIDTDVNHDGRVDTAVIHSPGQEEYYTDRDGDGQADELTIFAPDGDLISHEQLGADGHWHETPYHAPGHNPAPPDPGDNGSAPDTPVLPNDGHIAVNYNGTRYDAGEATMDSNGDGRPDTAIIRSPGQIEYYIDRNGDGKADELTITTPGGDLISHEQADPTTGRWRETPVTGPLPKPH
jgi:hypothetical protein